MAGERARTVMFHIGRSGSGVLGDLLGQHPEIVWDGEIVKPRQLHRQLGPPMRWLWPGAPLRGRALLSVVRRRAAAAPPDVAFGFEVKFFHLERERVGLPRFLSTVRASGIDRFVVLRRKNTLRTVVSGLVAARARTHHVTKDVTGPDPVVIDMARVPLDRREQPLVELLEHWDRRYNELGDALADERVLSLTYEDDVAVDPRHGYDRICEFLDVEPAPAEVHLRPTNPFSLAELITNLDDVRSALAGTRFAWMTEDAP